MRILNRPTVEIQISAGSQQLAENAARLFAQDASECVRDRGRFAVALSGGSTPKRMFAILAGEPYLSSVPWSSIFFFWGDERCVPPDHPDSNYGAANDILLSKAPIPCENIFRIQAEKDPHEAAADYSEKISNFLYHAQFDLIFLGMGADGHTASLFPHTQALKINDKIAAANYVEKFQAYRITLTARTINNSRNIVFLVAGDDKAEALKEVIDGPYTPDKYPSQLIKPTDGRLIWMVDKAAAKLLDK